MDLNRDGIVDILSGSYSRMEESMAGLFQVLYGVEGGGFRKPTPVLGTDEEPLIIQVAGEAEDVDVRKICTRPTAADLDGDGLLDIVTGNFGGSFAVFWGTNEGFDPVSVMLKGSDGKELTVHHHSDPVLVDWDADGDLDLVTGSGFGGVSMFPNIGTKTEARFGDNVVLVPTPEAASNGVTVFGDEHIKAPGSSTRVEVADLNGDGKLDLLLGDSAQLSFPAKGLTEEECLERCAAWDKEASAVYETSPDIADWENMTPEESEAQEAFNEKIQALYQKRSEFIEERGTGYVWALLQK
ncbi:FG-GAP repeat protein [Planctomycetes bacterium Poly30]|uniref:FG-GAP repeat protein n=1 Tax=Saltatorellus ferox TaxID=2528018 RepID=A0A518EPX2_9BACT|nr:FG-GAP repeat protein [Planctomycetes bacterium Poly30]